MIILSEEQIKQIKNRYPIGCRVVLRKMDDFQAPPVGTAGTVYGVDDTGSLLVHWDNGSSLGVIYGVDKVEKIQEND